MGWDEHAPPRRPDLRTGGRVIRLARNAGVSAKTENFAKALEAARKQVTLKVGRFLYHEDTWEIFGNPYGLNGHAALARMGLCAAA